MKAFEEGYGEPNPYLAARREWNERYGSYIAEAARWRKAFFAASAVATVAVTGAVYLATQSKIVPYIVQVDKLGRPLYVGNAEKTTATDPRIVRSFLGEWIADVRSVYTDAAAQHRLIESIYAHLIEGTESYAALNEYYKANNPFERAKNETASISVESVLPLSKDTWRVEWTETVRNRQGAAIGAPKRMEATVTASQQFPTDEKTAYANPLGLYVASFSWSEKL